MREGHCPTSATCATPHSLVQILTSDNEGMEGEHLIRLRPVHVATGTGQGGCWRGLCAKTRPTPRGKH